MKFGELEIGTRVQSCVSRTRIGVLTAKSDNFVMVEWSYADFVVETYRANMTCHMKILPKGPVTFGELEVGDVVNNGGLDETVVYWNSKNVVLDNENDDLVHFDSNKKLADAGRVFIRRGAK